MNSAEQDYVLFKVDRQSARGIIVKIISGRGLVDSAGLPIWRNKQKETSALRTIEDKLGLSVIIAELMKKCANVFVLNSGESEFRKAA